MNTRYFLALSLFAALGGCSSKGTRAGSSSGLVISNYRAEPGTITLNRLFKPGQPALITAEVESAESPVSTVKLQFLHVPLEVQLKHRGGHLWKAELTPQQLRMLAVVGQKMIYDANIVVRTQDGATSVSPDPLEIEVSVPAPDRG